MSSPGSLSPSGSPSWSSDVSLDVGEYEPLKEARQDLRAATEALTQGVTGYVGSVQTKWGYLASLAGQSATPTKLPRHLLQHLAHPFQLGLLVAQSQIPCSAADVLVDAYPACIAVNESPPPPMPCPDPVQDYIAGLTFGDISHGSPLGLTIGSLCVDPAYMGSLLDDGSVMSVLRLTYSLYSPMLRLIWAQGSTIGVGGIPLLRSVIVGVSIALSISAPNTPLSRVVDMVHAGVARRLGLLCEQHDTCKAPLLYPTPTPLLDPVMVEDAWRCRVLRLYESSTHSETASVDNGSVIADNMPIVSACTATLSQALSLFEPHARAEGKGGDKCVPVFYVQLPISPGVVLRSFSHAGAIQKCQKSLLYFPGSKDDHSKLRTLLLSEAIDPIGLSPQQSQVILAQAPHVRSLLTSVDRDRSVARCGTYRSVLGSLSGHHKGVIDTTAYLAAVSCLYGPYTSIVSDMCAVPRIIRQFASRHNRMPLVSDYFKEPPEISVPGPRSDYSTIPARAAVVKADKLLGRLRSGSARLELSKHLDSVEGDSGDLATECSAHFAHILESYLDTGFANPNSGHCAYWHVLLLHGTYYTGTSTGHSNGLCDCQVAGQDALTQLTDQYGGLLCTINQFATSTSRSEVTELCETLYLQLRVSVLSADGEISAESLKRTLLSVLRGRPNLTSRVYRQLCTLSLYLPALKDCPAVVYLEAAAVEVVCASSRDLATLTSIATSQLYEQDGKALLVHCPDLSTVNLDVHAWAPGSGAVSETLQTLSHLHEERRVVLAVTGEPLSAASDAEGLCRVISSYWPQGSDPTYHHVVLTAVCAHMRPYLVSLYVGSSDLGHPMADYIAREAIAVDELFRFTDPLPSGATVRTLFATEGMLTVNDMLYLARESQRLSTEEMERLVGLVQMLLKRESLGLLDWASLELGERAYSAGVVMRQKDRAALDAVIEETRLCDTLDRSSWGLKVLDFLRIASSRSRSENFVFRDQTLGMTDTPLFAQALSLPLMQESLVRLDLLRTSFATDDASVLVEAVSRLHLRKLVLDSSQFSTEWGKGCIAAHSFTVCSLHLDGIGLGAEGAASLSTLMTSGLGFPNLQTLSLSGNAIGDFGAVSLAPVLVTLGNLTVLTLDNNGISDIGVEAVASALSACPRLTSLCLDGNPITYEGAVDLVNSVRDLPVLRVVSLIDCDIDTRGELDLHLVGLTFVVKTPVPFAAHVGHGLPVQ
ncbi:hypothetical protein KIPB_003004 [Kipferlia bialata]|uniref:Uncharacterized protein n=1 Tax=Kipferlia bialata TaxID=797122 RepID=A0A391NUP9_9EUKA|nr:hypothetical protein KIPB_003004 [Kipferlia bialata]|eukprot:g3004.t1